MEIPEPEPGLVVRYDYLWSKEAATGRMQGKDRPACLVAATDRRTKPRYVVLLPITHSPPGANDTGIEIPASVRAALGLDDAPSWVIVSDHNVDEWPNGGLSPAPKAFAYGFIPPKLFKDIKVKFLELIKARCSVAVRRT
jgi:hypothetical protein